MNEIIKREELFENSFHSTTLAKAKAYQIGRGLLVIQLNWQKENTPAGQQFIWLLYSKQIEPILDLFDTLKQLSSTSRPLIIDDYNSGKDLISNMLIFSDGELTWHAQELEVDDTKGCVGWIVGQGNIIEEDQNGLIVVIISNFLRNANIPDPFIQKGIAKLMEIVKILDQEKIKYIEVSL